MLDKESILEYTYQVKQVEVIRFSPYSEANRVNIKVFMKILLGFD